MTERAARDWPLVTIALTALVVLIGLSVPEPSGAFDALVLDRERVHPWSWLTAHVVHTDAAHLTWNAFAFACLGTLAEPLGRARFVESMVIGVVAVDVWFACAADPSLRYYCGSSGALNTVLLATLYALRGSVPTRWLVAVAVVAAAKVGWEWHSGGALLTHSRWPAAVGAHVAGFIAGVGWIALLAARDRPAARL